MNEEQVEDIAEALYHPEHIADDLFEIAQVEDDELDKLIEVAYEQVKQLVRERASGSDAQVVIDPGKVANCGVELNDALVDEIVEYINTMVANCDYDIDDVMES
jgi:hypothetical protein